VKCVTTRISLAPHRPERLQSSFVSTGLATVSFARHTAAPGCLFDLVMRKLLFWVKVAQNQGAHTDQSGPQWPAGEMLVT
jgi:hypothetical protein